MVAKQGQPKAVSRKDAKIKKALRKVHVCFASCLNFAALRESFARFYIVPRGAAHFLFYIGVAGTSKL